MARALGYFETRWKPKSWNRRYRFIFIRKHVRRRHKAPIQLDLCAAILAHNRTRELQMRINARERPHDGETHRIVVSP